MNRLIAIGYRPVTSEEFKQMSQSFVKFEPCTVDGVTIYHYDIPWIRYHGMGYSQIVIKFITNQGYYYSLKPVGGSDGNAERYTRYDINDMLLNPGRSDILLNEEQCITIAELTADDNPLASNKDILRYVTA